MVVVVVVVGGVLLSPKTFGPSQMYVYPVSTSLNPSLENCVVGFVVVVLSLFPQRPKFRTTSTHVMQEDRTFVGQVNDLEEVLHSEGAIEARIRQVAGQIDKDYEGKTVVLIGILKGSGLQ